MEHFLMIVLLFAVLGIFLALALFVVGRVWALTIREGGFYGRNWIGRSTAISWSEVSSVDVFYGSGH
jgi:hypothetical protein